MHPTLRQRALRWLNTAALGAALALPLAAQAAPVQIDFFFDLDGSAATGCHTVAAGQAIAGFERQVRIAFDDASLAVTQAQSAECSGGALQAPAPFATNGWAVAPDSQDAQQLILTGTLPAALFPSAPQGVMLTSTVSGNVLSVLGGSLGGLLGSGSPGGVQPVPTLGGAAWLLLALGLAALAWRGRQGMNGRMIGRMKGPGMGGSAPLGLLGAIALGALGLGAPPPAHAGSAVIAPPPGTAAAPGQIVRAEFTQTAPGTGVQVRITVRKAATALPACETTVSWPADASKLPHTGITGQQCYRAGSDDLVACDSPEAMALSCDMKQDGMRRHINPMSYAHVPNPAGGHYDKTECVKDTVTGLIWEGKVDDSNHLRHYAKRYTNYGDGRARDTSEYVAQVNAQGLCGFNDWRLPTVRELQGLVDYSKPYPYPPINTDWFPHTWDDSNTYWAAHWASDSYASEPAYAWFVDFRHGATSWLERHSRGYIQGAVRLVRGAAPPVQATCPSSAPGRFVPTGVNGNEVKDMETGLTWARCSVGQSWDGMTCTGTASRMTHEAALAHAKEQAGWRLPNLKELSSLADLSCVNPAIDAAIFPNTAFGMDAEYLTATPFGRDSAGFWVVDFYYGDADNDDDGRVDYIGAVRLVRASQ
ncbi:DUF1566 domain-containing protein [Vandammella animalimorsus]|uniref:Lcl C-terminal domain-containing protein n=1 Tax=Vandammella animalimorsus TaxID=2029117 RepID=UPI00325AF2AD